MQDVLNEVLRCKVCPGAPCKKACPIGNDINKFISLAKLEQYDEANEVIRKNSMLPSICSKVCPFEKVCMSKCVLAKKSQAINIASIENYIVNNTDFRLKKPQMTDYKVAVIGAGPSGLSSALFLAKHGVNVTIFEKEDDIGGLLTYGIPSYRLPYGDVLRIKEELNYYNIKVRLNTELSYKQIIKLKEDYDYVYIALGLAKSKDLRIPDEDNHNVYTALDFLKDANISEKLNKKPKIKLKGTTCVIGAGNAAMDAARMALRSGSNEVYIVYRRSIEEAPCTKLELHEAKEDGVLFEFLKNPVKIILDDNKNISFIKCEVMTLSEADESGRRIPVGTNEFVDIKCDNLIKAIGQDPFIKKDDIIDLDYGYIKTDDDLKTNVEKIYAGGDIVLGASTVVQATKQGMQAAKKILEKCGINYED